MGFIAHSGAEPVGAAWVRLFLAHEADEYGFVDAATPELAASVVPDRQNSGIGTRLLVSLIEEARDVYPGVSLTARKGNHAVRLYESLGWKTIDEVTNRVGTTSVKMLLTF